MQLLVDSLHSPVILSTDSELNPEFTFIVQKGFILKKAILSQAFISFLFLRGNEVCCRKSSLHLRGITFR